MKISENLGNTPAGEGVNSETHPLRPFIPPHTRLLMCGTFPPQRHRWSMTFYYPNFINDMWRIFGLIIAGDKDYFVDVEKKTYHLAKLKETLTQLGIALSDTGREVVRTAGNAADKDLDIKRHIDLPAILTEMPDCVAVATTGEKAASIIAAISGSEIPKVGEYAEITICDSAGNTRHLQHWRMPSSSRAYPLPLPKKAAMYQHMLQSLGIIHAHV